MMTVREIGVLGAGIMGSGIGQAAAMSGFHVVVGDVKEEMLDRARQKVMDNLGKSIEKGKLTQKDSERVLSNLTWTVDFDEVVSGRDIIIEAVPENLDLKKEIFRILDERTKPQAILASNTSSFSISSLASATKNQGRVIGMHWFNPPMTMKLIEVIKGIATSSEAVEIVSEFAKACGKETVLCADSPGFIVTRALVALRLECYRIHSEGIASIEDIDKALKLGLAHPMGQFELADFSGLDIEPPICEALEKAYGERFKAPQNLLNRVRAGWFGRKSGRGWYDYSKS